MRMKIFQMDGSKIQDGEDLINDWLTKATKLTTNVSIVSQTSSSCIENNIVRITIVILYTC